MIPRTALVLGASGLVGSYVLQEILAQKIYSNVVVLVRERIDVKHEKLQQHKADFSKLENYKQLFNADDIFCCVGTTIKKAGSKYAFRKVDFDIPVKSANLASANGAKQFLVVSSLGADANARFFYMKTKGDMEETVKKIPITSIHVFRPSMLLGDRNEKRFGEKIGQVFMKIVAPLMLGNLKKYKAIHAETVAKAMIKIALQNKPGTYTYLSDAIARMGK